MNVCIHCGGDWVRFTKDLDLLEIDGHRFTATVPGKRCGKCGAERLDGPTLEKLDLLIAHKLIEGGVRSGAAFRFIRKALGLSGVRMAELFKVAPETICRWESEKRPVDHIAFATLGGMVLDATAGRTDTIDRLSTLRDPKPLAKTVRFDLSA